MKRAWSSTFTISSWYPAIVVCLSCLSLLLRHHFDLYEVKTKSDVFMGKSSFEKKANNASQKTLFFCGFDDQWNIGKAIFDDYQNGGKLVDLQNTRTHVNDVLLMVGLDGPCDVSQDDIRKYFPGKVLFINTEPRQGGSAEKQRLSNRFFKIGPSEQQEERTFPVYFGAIFWYATTSEQQRAAFWEDTRPNADRQNAVVFLASNCLSFRREAASRISDIVEVQYGKCGFFSTNHSKHIPHLTGRGSYIDNFKIYSHYKYCLVMENTEMSGYITEKIILAYLGGCIPIYWGTREVFDVFHNSSFIFYDINHPDEALRQLSQLQSNPHAFEAMQQAPILAKGNTTIEQFFSFSKNLGNGILRSRIRQMMEIDNP